MVTVSALLRMISSALAAGRQGSTAGICLQSFKGVFHNASYINELKYKNLGLKAPALPKKLKNINNLPKNIHYCETFITLRDKWQIVKTWGIVLYSHSFCSDAND